MSDPFAATDTVPDDQGTPGEPAAAAIESDAAADAATESVDAATATAPAESADTRLDLDGIERDLADVELALARLDSGEYWTDEVTGAAIPDEHLAEHPTARRLADR
jgi:RNA polymerase-binding transcription factor DksA